VKFYNRLSPKAKARSPRIASRCAHRADGILARIARDGDDHGGDGDAVARRQPRRCRSTCR
jgi:hypothetical protein